MANEVRGGVLNMASFTEIEDQDHQLVMTVPFTDTVTVAEHGKRPGK